MLYKNIIVILTTFLPLAFLALQYCMEIYQENSIGHSDSF